MLASLVTFLLILLVVTTASLAWGYLQTALALKKTRQANLATRRHLDAAQLKLAQQAIAKSHFDHARQLLDELLPQGDEEDLRGFEWYYLRNSCQRRQVCLTGDSGPLYCLALAPDSRTVCCGDGRGFIWRWDLVTGKLLSAVPGHNSVVWSIAYSPDGKHFVTGSVDRTVKVWRADCSDNFS